MGSIVRARCVWALLPVLFGCSQPESATPELEQPQVDPHLYDELARNALQSVGIDREFVSATLIAMALNRLIVVLRSLNPEVPDLPIGLIETDRGWRLQSPSMDDLADWLHRSSR